MSESWIKMRTNLATDPRVVELATALNVRRTQIVGGLYFLWSCADTFSTDGRTGYRPTFFDEEVGVVGFCEALRKLTKLGKPRPWIKIEDDGTVSICNFKDHNGSSAKKRAQTAQRASRFRNAHGVTKRAPRAEQSRAEQIREEKTLPALSSEPVGSEGKGGNSQGELPACLPATVREALQRLKIGEPALTRLADSPGLSVPHVMAAWEEAQEGNPRDPRRVLVHALCRIAGIELPKKRGTVGNALNSDPAFQRLSQTLNARRNRGS